MEGTHGNTPAGTLGFGNLSLWNPGAFDEGQECFEEYLDRFENYLIVRKIEADKDKVMALLGLIGVPIYNQLRQWTMPKHPRDLEWAELLQVLKDRFTKKKLVMTHRHSLLGLTQKPGQSLEEYYREIDQAAGECEFDKVTDVGEMVTSMMFVRGIRSDQIRGQLLKQEELQGIKLLQEAQTVDAAKTAATELYAGRKGQPVSWVQTDNGPQGQGRAQRSHGFGKEQGHGQRWQKDTCNNCGARGHWAKDCRKPKGDFHNNNQSCNRYNRAHQVIMEDDEEPQFFQVKPVYRVDPPIYVNVQIEGAAHAMELDTGAGVTIVDTEVWKKIGKPPLVPVAYTARSYSGEEIPFKGTMEVQVEIQGKKILFAMHVLEGKGDSLLGRDLINLLELDVGLLYKNGSRIKMVHALSTEDQLQKILDEQGNVFTPGLGTCNKLKARLRLKEDVRPRFFKARNLPFAVKPKISEHIDEQVRDGIIVPVTHSEWASPIVVVPKPNGQIRMCGDYKVSINPVLDVDQYPLHKIGELFHELNGGKKFSKMDLEKAYLQIELGEESKALTTIATHKGLFQFQRLPFGVASAPAIFQNIMEKMLQGINGVVIYLDDIVVTGRTDKEHLDNLETVLRRMNDYGVRLKKSKCEFFKDTIQFLGHIIDKDGVRTDPIKVKGIVNMPAPKNVKEVESFVGMVNYYSKYIENMSTLLAPINGLRKKDAKFEWTKEREDAFQEVKKKLQSTEILTHFNPDLSVVLATDASDYGLGAVIFHKMPDGMEKVIAYASRTLTTTEQKYAPIEKEALGIVWGIEKFEEYLYGKKFILWTDHQPLLKIFGPKNGVPVIAAKRLHRWAVRLMQYSFDIEYKNTNEFGNPDGLSRLPDPTEQISDYMSNEEKPFNKQIVKEETGKDELLQEVLRYVRSKWPEKIRNPALQRFKQCESELEEREGCLMRGTRLVVPQSLQDAALRLLHETHTGMVKMKMLARERLWFPGMDKEIEKIVRNCQICQEDANAPTRNELHPWEIPEQVWDRLHLDFVGPFENFMWLLIIDAKSKWPNVIKMKKTGSKEVIRELEKLFTIFGFPKQIVTDNGPQFASKELAAYCTQMGIKHTFTAPYSPASNGEAERNVQTFKKAVQKCIKDGMKLDEAVHKFLGNYRNTPHVATGKAPAEMMFGRRMKTKLDVMKIKKEEEEEHVMEKVTKYTEQMKKSYDVHAKSRAFRVGEKIWVRDYSDNPKWMPGKIEEIKGRTTYFAKTMKGLWHRHTNQLRGRNENELQLEEIIRPNSQPGGTEDISKGKKKLAPKSTNNPTPRRSSRISKPPKRYDADPRYHQVDRARARNIHKCSLQWQPQARERKLGNMLDEEKKSKLENRGSDFGGRVGYLLQHRSPY